MEKRIILLLGMIFTAGILFLGDVLAQTDVPANCFFKRGDANRDGGIDLSDAITILNYMFQSGNLICLDAADTNDDGIIDITDPIYLLNYLFLAGKEPPAPFAEYWIDLTRDGLGCGKSDESCAKDAAIYRRCSEGLLDRGDGLCKCGDSLVSGGYCCGFGESYQTTKCEYQTVTSWKNKETISGEVVTGSQQDIALCKKGKCGTYDKFYGITMATKDNIYVYNDNDVYPDVSTDPKIGSVVVWERREGGGNYIYMCGTQGLEESTECEKEKILVSGGFTPSIKYSESNGLILVFEPIGGGVSGCIVNKGDDGKLFCEVTELVAGVTGFYGHSYPKLTGGIDDVLIWKDASQNLGSCRLTINAGGLACDSSGAYVTDSGSEGIVIGTGDAAGSGVYKFITYAKTPSIGLGSDTVFINGYPVRLVKMDSDNFPEDYIEDPFVHIKLYDNPGLMVADVGETRAYVVFMDVNTRSELLSGSEGGGLSVEMNRIWVLGFRQGQFASFDSGDVIEPAEIYRVVAPGHISTSGGSVLYCNDLKRDCWVQVKLLGNIFGDGSGFGDVSVSNQNDLFMCSLNWLFDKKGSPPACLRMIRQT